MIIILIETLKTFAAEQGFFLCDILLLTSSSYSPSSVLLKGQRAIGKLCNTINKGLFIQLDKTIGALVRIGQDNWAVMGGNVEMFGFEKLVKTLAVIENKGWLFWSSFIQLHKTLRQN